MGLGLDEDYLWSLTPRQYASLQSQWSRFHRLTFDMLATLRADVHNGWMPRKNGEPWTAQEFGASGKQAKRRDPRKKWTPQEFQQKAIRHYGPDGKGVKAWGQGSALAAIRGKGQSIPKSA